MGFKRNFGRQGSAGKREPFSWRGLFRKLIGGQRRNAEIYKKQKILDRINAALTTKIYIAQREGGGRGGRWVQRIKQ